MSSEKKHYEIFKYGSAWIKADFHLHTRADKQFHYEGEKNSFLKVYAAKLKDQSINIAAVTNHNKFDRDEFINLRKKAIKEEIFLLPDLELSVNDGANGIHTLVIFSDTWLENRQDYINQFLNVAFEGKTPAQYEQEDGRSSLSLLETIKKLDGYHRDYFLIFAHVEQGSGLWCELDGGRLGELAKNRQFRDRTLGFQQVKTHDVPDRVCRIKVQSWFEDWYPAEVEGSDCKSIDEIGLKERETWLKLGDFTYEAVKYALVDYRNRVKKQKPEVYKHSHIKSISFEGGTLNGQSIYFSPELNTLIGIRGSGKSSILEAIRYVLDIPFGDQATDKDYKTKLVANALIHRDYFISAPIRIFIFENRIEIISPGHLPNNLTIQNIKSGNSNIRNPVLASFATKLLPYRGLGNGIRRALKAYPQIDFVDDRENNMFIVTIAL